MTTSTTTRRSRPKRTYPVNHGELGDLLKSFRVEKGETRSEVAKRMDKVLKEAWAHSWEPFHRIFRDLVELEGGSAKDLDLQVGDLELAARSYAIHRLLLDPLISRPVDDSCVIHDEADRTLLEPVVGQTHGKDGAAYYVPNKRLGIATSDLSVVYLELPPGAESDTHAHAGDEFMYTIEGSVELRLHGTGMHTRLEKGDLAHFYSEQTHSARHPRHMEDVRENGPRTTSKLVSTQDSVAKVLIVRFYQLSNRGSRFELLQALSAKTKTPNLDRRLVAEMTHTLKPFELGGNGGVTASTQVLDRFGLGRLLQLASSSGFRGPGKAFTLDDLKLRAQQRRLKFNRSRIDRLHQGLTPVGAAELPDLAAMYEVEPMLLFHYLFPAVRSAIAVREDPNEEDWEPVPRTYVKQTEATYHVPKRRLAESDIAVAKLKLEPGAATPENRHPGFELLRVNRGTVEIRFTESQLVARVEYGKHLFAHYDSHRLHQVFNPGPEPAEALVIRFYQ